MFDSLRDAFREAVSNFKDEIGRDNVPEAVDRLLVGMKNEVTDAKAYARRLESEIEQNDVKVEREGKAAATARRRARMAAEIGDAETAQVATEYAEKHERSLEILAEKADALRKELHLREADIAEMMTKLRSAMADRDGLAATAGRAQTRGSIGEADDLFAQLDRMEEKIEGTQSQADAAREMDRDFAAEAPRNPNLERDFQDLEDAPASLSVEERLEELKRRMGES